MVCLSHFSLPSNGPGMQPKVVCWHHPLLSSLPLLVGMPGGARCPVPPSPAWCPMVPGSDWWLVVPLSAAAWWFPLLVPGRDAS